MEADKDLSAYADALLAARSELTRLDAAMAANRIAVTTAMRVRRVHLVRAIDGLTLLAKELQAI